MQYVGRVVRIVLRLLRWRLQCIMSRVWRQFVVSVLLGMWRIRGRVTESLGRQRRGSCRYLAKRTVRCESGVISQTPSTYGAAATFKTAFKLRGLLRLLIVGRRNGRKQRSASAASFRHGGKKDKTDRTIRDAELTDGGGRQKRGDSTIVRHDWTSSQRFTSAREGVDDSGVDVEACMASSRN
jgi:hypothetical protein